MEGNDGWQMSHRGLILERASNPIQAWSFQHSRASPTASAKEATKNEPQPMVDGLSGFAATRVILSRLRRILQGSNGTEDDSSCKRRFMVVHRAMNQINALRYFQYVQAAFLFSILNHWDTARLFFQMLCSIKNGIQNLLWRWFNRQTLKSKSNITCSRKNCRRYLVDRNGIKRASMGHLLSFVTDFLRQDTMGITISFCSWMTPSWTRPCTLE